MLFLLPLADENSQSTNTASRGGLPAVGQQASALHSASPVGHTARLHVVAHFGPRLTPQPHPAPAWGLACG